MKENPLFIPLTAIKNKYVLNFGTRSSGEANEHLCLVNEIESAWLLPSLQTYKLNTEDSFLGNIELVQTNDIVKVSGALKLIPELECVKCLKQFRTQVISSVDAFFSQESTATGKKPKDETELKERELGEYFYKNNVINIEEMMLDCIETAIPLSPVCGENCLGLCFYCGIDQNVHGICQEHTQTH